MDNEEIKDIALLNIMPDDHIFHVEEVKIHTLINQIINVYDFDIQAVKDRKPYIFLFRKIDSDKKEKCFTTATQIKETLDNARRQNSFPFRCKVICEKGRYYKFVSAQS